MSSGATRRFRTLVIGIVNHFLSRYLTQ